MKLSTWLKLGLVLLAVALVVIMIHTGAIPVNQPISIESFAYERGSSSTGYARVVFRNNTDETIDYIDFYVQVYDFFGRPLGGVERRCDRSYTAPGEVTRTGSGSFRCTMSNSAARDAFWAKVTVRAYVEKGKGQWEEVQPERPIWRLAIIE